jgi:hypothetical protein
VEKMRSYTRKFEFVISGALDSGEEAGRPTAPYNREKHDPVWGWNSTSNEHGWPASR